jgi:hypothetical protein
MAASLLSNDVYPISASVPRSIRDLALPEEGVNA